MSAVWGNLFFLSRPKSKSGVKPNLEGFFPTKQAIRIQLVDMVSYHSRIKMTMDEKEEHKEKSPSVEKNGGFIKISVKLLAQDTQLINWSSPWFTVTKAGCHVPYQLPMF